MATHDTPASMLKESLMEFLEAANYCSAFRKTDDKWGDFKTGGCLGYPGATLCFAIIDSLGSYFRQRIDFKVSIDSKDVTIGTTGWEHFKILNSKYFNQSLSQDFIKALYNKFRSYLTHNSVLGEGCVMIMDNESLKNGTSGQAFFMGKSTNGEDAYIISIKELCELCEKAVEKFLKDVDKVVPNSKQGKKFH